jgi:ribosomal protein S18 acetylase RimI-like enzyme
MGSIAMPARYALTQAGANEIRILVAHRHRMFSDIGGHSEESIRRQDRRYRSWILERLLRDEVVAVMARDANGRVVASGCVWFRDEQPRPETRRMRSAYILSVYTANSARRHRLASRLTRRLVSIVRRRGYSRVALHASPMGRALYERLGFERTWEMRLILARSARPPRVRAKRAHP